MMYRNDHDAALARLEALERENKFLVEELTRAGARKPRRVRTSWHAGFVQVETTVGYAVALCLLAIRIVCCS